MTSPVELPGRSRLFAAACAAMFVYGIVLALLGTLFGLPAVRARLQVDLAQQGDLFVFLYVAVAVATILSGPLIDRFGNKPVLLVSSVLVAAALLLFADAHSMAAAAYACVLLGVGGGGLNTSANVLVSDAFVEDRGARLNLIGMFYGVGALFLPLLAASITQRFTVTQLMVAAAVLPAACALACAGLPFPPAREGHGFALQELAVVAHYPAIFLFAALLFCESGNEAALGGYASSYMGGMGAEAHTATYILAAFWAALTLGRLAAARLLRYLGKSSLVLASGTSAVAGCLVIIAGGSLALVTAGVILAGFAFAAIYPTMLAIAGDRYPRYSGTVFALLFAIGLSGGTLFPWAMGQIAQASSLRVAMATPVAGSIAVCALMAVIVARDRAAPHRRNAEPGNAGPAS